MINSIDRCTDFNRTPLFSQIHRTKKLNLKKFKYLKKSIVALDVVSMLLLSLYLKANC